MGKFIKCKKNILYLLVLVELVIGPTVLAGLVNWPSSPLGTSLNPKTSTLPDLIRYLYEWGIGLGGLAAFVALVIAGFQYLTSMGDPVKMKGAKDRAVWAIGGLILLLTTWLILNTINPQLTTLQFPSFNLNQMEKNFSTCSTSQDCESDFECYCLKGENENMVGEKGTTEHPCEVGYCAPGAKMVTEKKIDICNKALVTAFKNEGDFQQFELEEGPCEERTIDGGSTVTSVGYIRKEANVFDFCGQNAWGYWSSNCTQCIETNNQEACDNCCWNCIGDVVFFADRNCNAALISIPAASAAFMSLDHDVHSVRLMKPIKD